MSPRTYPGTIIAEVGDFISRALNAPQFTEALVNLYSYDGSLPYRIDDESVIDHSAPIVGLTLEGTTQYRVWDPDHANRLSKSVLLPEPQAGDLIVSYGPIPHQVSHSTNQAP